MEKIWLSCGNRIDVILKAGGSAANLGGVTSMMIVIGTSIIRSSNVVSDPIRWNQAGYASGEVRFTLGSLALSVGRYNAPLVVYEPAYPDGIMWGHLQVVVDNI